MNFQICYTVCTIPLIDLGRDIQVLLWTILISIALKIAYFSAISLIWTSDYQGTNTIKYSNGIKYNGQKLTVTICHNIFLQLDQYKITHMLQSFSRNFIKDNQHLKLKCHRCRQKPNQEFILLLCDHVICSPCLEEFNSGRESEYDGVKCPCGVITYFNINQSCSVDQLGKRMLGKYYFDQDGINGYMDDKQVTEHKKNKSNYAVNIHDNRNERKTKQVSIRGSAGMIQSKNTASTKNISRLNTQSLVVPQSHLNDSLQNNLQSRMKNKHLLQKSKYSVLSKQSFQDTSRQLKTIINRDNGNFRSLDSFKNKKQNIRNQQGRNRKKNQHYQPKYIQSESLVSQKQNLNPNRKKKNQKKIKDEESNSQFSDLSSNQQQFHKIRLKNPSKNRSKHHKDNSLTNQLKSQINFIKLGHKKALQDLNRCYYQAVNKINEDFGKLESDLQDLCLQTIALNKNQSQINFGKLIKIRYETLIGNKVERLKQQIKKYSSKHFDDSSRPMFSSPQIQHRKERFSSPLQYKQPIIYAPSQQSHLPISGFKQKGRNEYQKGDNIGYCTHNYNIPIRYTISNIDRDRSKLQKKGVKKRTNITIEL